LHELLVTTWCVSQFLWWTTNCAYVPGGASM